MVKYMSLYHAFHFIVNNWILVRKTKDLYYDMNDIVLLSRISIKWEIDVLRDNDKICINITSLSVPSILRICVKASPHNGFYIATAQQQNIFYQGL